MNSEASSWIARLRLKKHPEGGYFRETYRSEMTLDVPGYVGRRHASSAIYYLLLENQVSLFHRVKSDELWHHYAGGSLTLYKINTDGRLSKVILGKQERGSRPQTLIESNCWTAASVRSGSFCLVGCTVSPGFEYRDWELGTASQLITLYPRHKKIIEKYAPLFNSRKNVG